MHHLSVKISEQLYQKLEAKTQEMGAPNISDAVRLLLTSAVEKPQAEMNLKVQNKILNHTVTTYYLMKEYIKSQLGEDGVELNNIAHNKTERALMDVLEE